MKKTNKRINIKKTVHVVAAVIENASGDILIAKRPLHVHQGGLWEFPGGKVELSESTTAALKRELLEELDIQVTHSEPLFQIHHDYADKSVFLDVFHVKKFSGIAKGNEGQAILWVNKSQLSDFKFPAANKAIIDAAQLPREYLITPDHHLSERTAFLTQLEKKLAAGIKLIQLRAKNLSSNDFSALYYQVQEITDQHNTLVQVNTSIEHALRLKASGVHLTSSRLHAMKFLPERLSVSASCHNEKEMQRACEKQIRFIVLSPVQATTSHPNTPPLGWETFAQLCEKSTIPVFALGGMERKDSDKAMRHGAQGIAAISGLWFN